MKALVYHGPGDKAWEEVPDPRIVDPTDAIIRVDAVTICGTDLHILEGDVPAVHRRPDPRPRGGRDGHRGRRRGDHRPSPATGSSSSCISACGRCRYCREGAYGQCLGGGGWILGHPIDGVQAEYARIPFADLSTYPLPPAVSDEAAVMLADILPTSYEVGVLNGKVQPGDTVVVVGAGPDRPGRDPGRPALLPRRTSSPSTSPTAGSTRPSSSARTSSINAGRGPARDRAVAHRRARRRRGDRGGRRRRRRSSCAPRWSAPAATSPTSACTASRPRCTSRTSGSATSPSRPAWSTPRPRRRCCGWSRRPARRGPVGHPPVRARPRSTTAYDVFAKAADTGALKVVLTRTDG